MCIRTLCISKHDAKENKQPWKNKISNQTKLLSISKSTPRRQEVLRFSLTQKKTMFEKQIGVPKYSVRA